MNKALLVLLISFSNITFAGQWVCISKSSTGYAEHSWEPKTFNFERKFEIKPLHLEPFFSRKWIDHETFGKATHGIFISGEDTPHLPCFSHKNRIRCQKALDSFDLNKKSKHFIYSSIPATVDFETYGDNAFIEVGSCSKN